MAKFELNEEEMEDLVESGVLDHMDVQCKSLNQEIIRKTKLIEVNKNALKENSQQQERVR